MPLNVGGNIVGNHDQELRSLESFLKVSWLYFGIKMQWSLITNMVLLDQCKSVCGQCSSLHLLVKKLPVLIFILCVFCDSDVMSPALWNTFIKWCKYDAHCIFLSPQFCNAVLCSTIFHAQESFDNFKILLS